MSKTSHFLIGYLSPLAGVGVALFVIFLLYRDLDFPQFFIELKQAKLVWIIALALAILIEQLIQGWKWRQLLYDLKPIASTRLTGAFFAGYCANCFVPLGVSPLVRSWLVARLESLKMSSILVTTIISRFVDGIVFGLLALTLALIGNFPRIDGDLQTGIAVAGILNFIIFSIALWILFYSRTSLTNDKPVISRAVDKLALKCRGMLGDLRSGLVDGIIWPRQITRQLGIVTASVAMKIVSTTHFLWAGLALGILLPPLDYLFVMVFAGFALVLARFIRVPGGFVIGSGFALKLLGVPDETAVAMILLTHVMALILVVSIGTFVLWRSGISIRLLRTQELV